MVSRRFSAWQKVVALAPLLLLALYLPGQMMLRCRMDGMLRPACCCPDDSAPAQEVGPVVKAQDCCARELTSIDRPVVEPAQLSTVDSTGALAAVLPVVPFSTGLVDSARSERAWRSHGPPREGPPSILVLLKHAFLI